MRIFQRGRTQGKTHHLTRWMLAKPGKRGVLVPNSAQRDFFLGELYSAMTPDDWSAQKSVYDTIHWPSLVRVPSLHRMRSTADVEWAADNLDMLLFDILGVRLVAATTTEPFENVRTL